ncbi:MAG: hydrocarbon-binding protein [Myxococcota bacterium]
MSATQDVRPTLGDFNSIVCFRAVVAGMEEALGKRTAMVSLKAAGRIRGAQLVESLGLTGKGPADADALARALDDALGTNGTRLCHVRKAEREGEIFRIHLAETICSADEPQGSDRELSFTFGALHGAIEALYGVKLRGKQVGSVLRGAEHDIMELEPR